MLLSDNMHVPCPDSLDIHSRTFQWIHCRKNGETMDTSAGIHCDVHLCDWIVMAVGLK